MTLKRLSHLQDMKIGRWQPKQQLFVFGRIKGAATRVIKALVIVQYIILANTD